MINIVSYDKLIKEWSKLPHHKGKCFFRDGIVDLHRWQKSKIKLLFLLKEAYPEKPKVGVVDLCSYIKNDWQYAKGNLYKNAAYWAYAVQHLTDKIAPVFPINEQWYEAIDYMLSSAFINVKKSSGQRTSDREQIKYYAQIDGMLLKQQIQLIKPQIVICGFTWESISHLWNSAKEIYDFVFIDSSIVFVDFWHPSNRFPMQLNYQALTNLLRSSQIIKIIKGGLTSGSS